MAEELKMQRCVPCEGGVPPVRGGELTALAGEVDDGWKVVDEHHIEREFSFPDFAKALEFTNAVGAIAEDEGHHPDIELGWGRVNVKLWTHAAGGLTKNDFIVAAKIDAL